MQGIELAVGKLRFLFQIVKKDGALGLWEYIKEKFQDLQATVMDATRDKLRGTQEFITKLVEAGIKWIISLMNPASAFVKAVLMIIDIAKFFIERAADIIELVMAFIDGIRALAAGNIQGVAKLIEKALAKAIPILLGFLASLLGISGLTAKVTKIIGKIKGKVDKAINKVINKAFGMFKKKGGKGKQTGVPEKEEAGDKNDKALKDGKLGEVVKFNAGESHTLWIVQKGKKSEVMVASDNPGPVGEKLKKWKSEQMGKPKSTAKTEAIEAIETAQSNVLTVEATTKEADALLALSKTADFDKTKREKLNALDARLEKEEKELSKSLATVFKKMGGGNAGNLEQIFEAESKSFHVQAAPVLKDTISKISKLDVSEQDKIKVEGLQSWTGMEALLKKYDPAEKFILHPLEKSTSYGKYVREQLERAIAKGFPTSNEAEKKEKTDKAINRFEGSYQGKGMMAIRQQMFRKNHEPEADEVLAHSVKGEEGEHSLYKIDLENAILESGDKEFILKYMPIVNFTPSF